MQKYTAERVQTTPFHVYLLLSISRSTLADANETLEIARDLLPQGVVRGVELSGNPFAGDADAIAAIFRRAQEFGLPYTLHTAEKRDDAEVAALLALRPPRVGHGIFTPAPLLRAMERDGTAVEVCLTSNVVSRSIPDAASHPVLRPGAFAGPVVFCCDDRGLFRTTLSDELAKGYLAYHKNETLPGFLAEQFRVGLGLSFLTPGEREKLASLVPGPERAAEA